MDRENENKVTRVIIGVLAVLLVIVTILWLNAKRDMVDVLDQMESSVTDYQVAIEDKCGGLTPAQVSASDDCQKILRDFAEMLERYDRMIEEEIQEDTAATSTTP